MSIGEDRVQVTKTESTALGGKDSDADIYGAPIPLNPQEDAIESAGGYVQDSSNRDEAVGWFRDSESYHLFDEENTVGISLTQFQCIPNFIIETRTMTVPENYQLPVHDEMTVDGVLVVDGELVVF